MIRGFKVNYLDLFSGIGGFHLGLEQAGFKFDWVGFSEIDKYATQIYKEHFNEAEELGSIIDIRPKTLPEIDLVTFGFPCQDLSVAGKRKGLSGQRSGLFFEAMRIIEDTKPKIFIFENVKGLFSSNNGRDWWTVLQTIADLGLYECEWQLCNTRWFLPQNRERIFFVGHLRGRSRPKVFPFREVDKIFTEGREKKGRVQAQCAGSLEAQGGCRHTSTYVHKAMQWRRTEDGKKIRRENQKKGRDYTPFSGGARELVESDKNEIGALTAQAINKDSLLSQDTQIRRLTPTECERLQGFSDGWTKSVSDSQRYKTLGNSVSIPVVKAIGERLLK